MEWMMVLHFEPKSGCDGTWRSALAGPTAAARAREVDESAHITLLERASSVRAEITRVHPLCHDAFFPGAAPLSIELAHDPRDGRILAADAWGTEGVDTRIDVLATAIAGGLGIADRAGLDLAYEPAFSTARDPVNVAGARKLALRTEYA